MRLRGALVAVSGAAFCLVALAAPAPVRLPPVYLNHVYRVLDRETFEAAEHSGYLRTEFAQFERRSTKSGTDSWSGLYFYGEHTYFEFLQADPGRDRPVGACGIGLGIEEPGASAAVHSALETAGQGSVTTMVRPRETPGGPVPWFRMTGLEPKDPGLVTFVMEYDPEFLKQWNPDILPSLSGISRSAVLERYRAKAAREAPAPGALLQDITGVTLALTPDQANLLAAELSALGYRNEKVAGRNDWVGPDVRFSVVPASEGASGITALEMSLNRRRLDPKVVALGRARLEVRPSGTATLTF